MKPITTLLSLTVLPLIVQASLNCTVVPSQLTQRYCEWDSCQVFATASAGSIAHAGCRADCSTLQEPWLQLYDGSFIKATTDSVMGCLYHCIPYNVTGLPYCYQEKNQPAPTNCAASSSAGLASAIPAPSTLGPEPPAASGVISMCASQTGSSSSMTGTSISSVTVPPTSASLPSETPTASLTSSSVVVPTTTSASLPSETPTASPTVWTSSASVSSSISMSMSLFRA